jgi:hypothetical protein
MGTGDGAVLAGIAPLPALTVAYEEWWPTVPAARARLRPIGVQLVVALGSADNVGTPTQGAEDAGHAARRPGLPFGASAFDVVLNRHEAFDPTDVHRVTRPGGWFLTQQVGSDETASVRALLALPNRGPVWNAAIALDQLSAAGWRVEDVREERPSAEFADIAALVGYVRTLAWEFEDLEWEAASPVLKRLHRQSLTQPLELAQHRFLIVARKL